ncbi:TetR/AcrR family transcriptional regulator [Pseudofrankia sp. BMG5.37]|uniref:TetR/AcrR family transcriptional regulator n=1 Tax=Pseudofrankia sp. BMG5.37 TaxID=3050035 RepID=UPI0028947FF6|nr:TetR/AcrR family transcriptional regulator [Pseudofrankia sp. BMG5.37]MDT3440173.1 TetR/AcrR family transcriptional regulator [Pseudofrankia sp. BMG5.37]
MSNTPLSDRSRPRPSTDGADGADASASSPGDGAPDSRRRGALDSPTRVALIDAAEQLMLEEGYAAVTTRRVAATAAANPGLVYYYFGTLDDLLLAVFRRGADKALARQARALASPRPLHALWELATDPRGTALLLEFMALANHRKAIRAEIASYSERYREAELATLTRLVDRREIDLGGVPPSVMAMLMPSIARTLVMEDTLGVKGSHEETISYIEECLRRVEEHLGQPCLPAPDPASAAGRVDVSHDRGDR